MAYGRVQRAVRVCIGFIFAVFFVLCWWGAVGVGQASAATLSVATGRATYEVGDTIVARVYVGSAGQAVNAFQGTVTLPAAVDFSSVSVEGSIVSFWVQQPSYAGQNNAVSFSGVVMNPGFVGDRGLLLTIYGRAKSVGTGSFSISNGSVLANDGQGTEILTSVANASITVDSSEIISPAPPASSPAPIISSATDPDQSAWYNDNTATFLWPQRPGVQAVRLVFDKNKATLPAVTYDPPIWTKTIASIADGTWYLRVQEKTSAGWGAIGTYQVNIDTTPPRDFTITLLGGAASDNPRPVISFGTTDDLSGVDHYLVAIDGQSADAIPAGTPGSVVTYTVPLQTPGQKTITVTAVDRAGNTTQSVAQVSVLSIAPPVIDSYPLQSTAGDAVIIRGHALAGESVFLTLTKEGGQPSIESVSTTPAGTFALLWPATLDQGMYQLSAYAVDARGAQSDPTAPVELSVSPQAWLGILTSWITYGSLLVFILFFVLGASLAVLYLFRRLNRFGRMVVAEKRDAENTLHDLLIRLAAHVRNHVDVLEATKSKRVLSQEEEALIKDLRKDITDIEKKIGKKLDASDSESAGGQ